MLWDDLELLGPDGVDCLGRHGGAVAEPLRNGERLDDVLGARAPRNHHRVVGLPSVQTQLLQLFLNRNPRVIPVVKKINGK